MYLLSVPVSIPKGCIVYSDRASEPASHWPYSEIINIAGMGIGTCWIKASLQFAHRNMQWTGDIRL